MTNDPSPLEQQTAAEPRIPPEYVAGTLTPTREPDDSWWELGRAFLAWLSSVILLIFVPLLIIIPYFVYLIVNKMAPSAEALAQDKTFLLLSIAGVIPAHIFTLCVAWALVTRWGRRPFWKTLRLYWPPQMSAWKGIGISFLVAIVLLGIGALITTLVGGGKTDLDQLIESSYQARLATAFLAVATAPLVEEVIYRGMLYPAVQRIVGIGWAVVIVAVMFAGVHVYQYRHNLGVIIVITILSITLTLIRAYTGTLLASVVIHLIFNGLQSLYLVLEPFISKPEKIEPTPAPALFELYRVIHHLF